MKHELDEYNHKVLNVVELDDSERCSRNCFRFANTSMLGLQPQDHTQLRLNTSFMIPEPHSRCTRLGSLLQYIHVTP